LPLRLCKKHAPGPGSAAPVGLSRSGHACPGTVRVAPTVPTTGAQLFLRRPASEVQKTP